MLQREQFTAETHTYDEILAEKRRSDSALQDARKDLSEAKRKAAISGTYMDPDRFAAIERRIIKLSRKSQKLQDQLGISRRMSKRRTVEAHFLDVCKENFTDEFLGELIAEAKRRHHAPVQEKAL